MTNNTSANVFNNSSSATITTATSTNMTAKDIKQNDSVKETAIRRPDNILLLENKPSQTALLHLNIYVYLNGRLEIVKNAKDISVLHEKIKTYNLIITRREMYGYNLLAQIKDILDEQKLKIPIIVINSKINPTELTTVKDPLLEIISEPLELKDILKKSANLLQITPKMMADMSLPTYFSVSSSFMQYLQYAPCDVFKRVDQGHSKNYVIVFSNGVQLDDEVVSQTISSNSELYVLSQYRLKFVKSFTEQLRFSSVENENYEVVTKEKVFYANKQMNKISDKLKDVGVDQEVIEMSRINLERLLEIAQGANDLSKLVSVLVSGDNSFRLKESQLLTYMTFHVLKILNMWTEKKMQVMSYASFFHDILLDDNLATARKESDAKDKKCTQQQISAIDNHAGVIATVVKKILPDVSANKDISTVLREHHGSISGKGFCDEISSFGLLSKIFFLTQKWVFQVLTSEGKNIQHQVLIKKLKEDFTDNMSIKIIDALALVEVNEILHALTGDLDEENTDNTLKKESVVNNVVDVLTGKEPDENIKLEVDATLTGMVTSMKVVSILVKNDKLKKILSAKNSEDLSQLNYFIASLQHLPEEDKKEIIKGTTAILEESALRIKEINDPNELNDNTKNTIKSVAKNIENVANLIQEKFNNNIAELVKVRNQSSKTMLMIACQAGSVEQTKTLIEAGADVKAKDSMGKTALHYAAMAGNLEIVKILTTLGLSVNAIDSKRRTPIVMAIHYFHNTIFDFFVNREARTNLKLDQGMDLVMFSASVGNLYALAKLAVLKVPLNSFDYRGRNAYFFAKNKGHREIMVYLQENVKGLPKD
ncbi:MAG: ankyrin repeat domain-containing protein [Oligoflexia bacterium]|nr:ankyrin repeat domain-containing protein [Oligoflexia bacterium]